jgi:hypothetical protein
MRLMDEKGDKFGEKSIAEINIPGDLSDNNAQSRPVMEEMNSSKIPCKCLIVCLWNEKWSIAWWGAFSKSWIGLNYLTFIYRTDKLNVKWNRHSIQRKGSLDDWKG